MSAQVTSQVEAGGDDEPRLRMIRELERFLSSALPTLNGRRVVPRALGQSPKSRRWTSTGRRQSWYDDASRTPVNWQNIGLEMGPC
jgi:hypothetical protein